MGTRSLARMCISIAEGSGGAGRAIAFTRQQCEQDGGRRDRLSAPARPPGNFVLALRDVRMYNALMTTTNDKTLHQTLAAAGWRSEPSRKLSARRVYDASGALVGHLTAHETWALLRERGVVA